MIILKQYLWLCSQFASSIHWEYSINHHCSIYQVQQLEAKQIINSLLFFFVAVVCSYQFYIHIKADVIDGRLLCSSEQAVLFAAYAAQGLLPLC